jgi:hypothetical protein
VSITFAGNSTGKFSFNKVNTVGISMGTGSVGSFDSQANPTEGIIEVIQYDKTGGKIVLNVYGAVFDGNGVPHILNGTFSVTRIQNPN